MLSKQVLKGKTGRGAKIDSDRPGAILTLKGAFGVQNAYAICDSDRLVAPVLRIREPSHYDWQAVDFAVSYALKY